MRVRQRSRPLAIMVGSLGKLPLGGHSFFCTHYLCGLQDLGYEVHYVERQNRTGECYDPSTGEMTDDPTYALEYLDSVLGSLGITRERYSFVDLSGRCHGSDWARLHEAIKEADFIMTVANPTWFEELARCPRTIFVDVDPLFTHVAMATGQGTRADAPFHYQVLATYGTRIGQPDCPLPDAGRRWLATRPVVATRLWTVTGPRSSAPVAAILHWAAGSEVTYDGRTYGHKDRELTRFIDMPRRCSRRFAIAAAGAPRDRFQQLGWDYVSPAAASRSMETFQSFVASAWADFGVAKHAYVASRCGWFSDRSTCFLAAGRPVLHQDTGFGDWLPTGKGVLKFVDPDDALAAIAELERDYDAHARAARAIALEHFEASTVIASMLNSAGYR